ncbi:glycosyl hydrolase 108 family protein [Mesorhizobium sp. B294B1A1]|nr:glycosyl hydrolase 108 family protein [Mesorhizobium sp. B294B1A1]
MTASREKESLAKVLVHEGGYVNHEADPGGPTNKGVTQRRLPEGEGAGPSARSRASPWTRSARFMIASTGMR